MSRGDVFQGQGTRGRVAIGKGVHGATPTKQGVVPKKGGLCGFFVGGLLEEGKWDRQDIKNQENWRQRECGGCSKHGRKERGT